MFRQDSTGHPAGTCTGVSRNWQYLEMKPMTATKTVNHYPVMFRAVEGIALIALMMAFLAINWILRREPPF